MSQLDKLESAITTLADLKSNGYEDVVNTELESLLDAVLPHEVIPMQVYYLITLDEIGLTNREIANRIGVSVRTIQRWWAGRSISLKNYAKLSRLYSKAIGVKQGHINSI